MKIQNKKLFPFLLFTLSLAFYAAPILFLWWPQWQSARHLAFNWPDASANFWAVESIINHRGLGEFDPLNIPSDFLLHTRSQNVIDGLTVPMTFLPSLFLLASLSWLFGAFASLLLVPLLATSTVLIFYLLIKKLFASERAAMSSAILLATLGPWLYFAAQPLLPNILVLFLAILSLYALLKEKYLAASLFFALAIVCRPPELVWLLPALLLFLYFYKPRVSKLRIFNSLLIFVAIILWALYLNKQVFGGYLLTGYSNFQTNGLPSGTSIGTNAFSWIFPFGFDPLLMLKNYAKYFVLLVWPYSIFMLLGIWQIRHQAVSSREKKYLLLYVLVSIILVLYYGSWRFADNLVLNLNTISISYVRYFLPLFLLAIPLVFWGIEFCTRNIKNKNFWQIIIIITLSLFSWRQVIFTKNDGWIDQARYIKAYYQEWQNIQPLAPPGSVIISERSDKYLYPYYRVVVPQGDLELWPRIQNIYRAVDIYYYSSEQGERLAETQKIMAASGLYLDEPVAITTQLNLYKVLSHR